MEIHIGDYVWATRWSDADPNDPWFVGYVEKVLTEIEYISYWVGKRWWRNCKLITKDQGIAILRTYPGLEGNKFPFWTGNNIEVKLNRD